MKKKIISNLGLVFCFFLLIIVTILLRLHTLNEPLERDITTYAIIGHGIFHGKIPYVDLWDHKPPLIYLIYGFFDLIFGMNKWSIFALNITINIGTLFAIYFAVKQLGNKVYALWSCIAWTIISGTLLLQANQPNTEAFLNLCMTLLAAFLLTALYNRKPARFAMWVGLIISSATLVKYIIVVPMFFMLLVFAIFEKSTNLKEQIRQLSKILFWTLLPWFIFAAYFGFKHALPEFYDAVIKYNQYYAGVSNGVENSHFIIHSGILSYIAFLFPSLVIIFIILLLMLFLKKYRPAALLSLVWLGLTPLTISLPGRDFPHYYQLWLPAYCIALGIALYIFELWKKPYSVYIASGLALFLMLTLTRYEYPSYKLSANEWSFQKYNEPQFIQTKETGQELSNFLKPDGNFFQWGEESGLYWYSHKNPITPVLHISHIAGGPVSDSLRKKIIDDLNNQPADLLVLNKNMLFSTRTDPTLLEILSHYAPIDDVYSVPGSYILPRIGETFPGRDLQKDLIEPLNHIKY
jgi:4-amino-4-deoxy-L-arabinose transferase-like glycosyltransferase